MKALLQFVSVLLLSAVLGHAQVVTNGNFGGARQVPESKSNRQKPSSAPKVKSYPYHGELESVAPDGSCFRLRGKAKPREIIVSARTRVSREDAKAALKDAEPGDRLSGSVFRDADGKEQALTVRISAGKPAKSRE